MRCSGKNSREELSQDRSGRPLRVSDVLTVPLGEDTVEAWNDCGDGWFDFLAFSGLPRSAVDSSRGGTVS